MFDLNDIALFVQVVRCGSFAEAARRLGISRRNLYRKLDHYQLKHL